MSTPTTARAVTAVVGRPARRPAGRPARRPARAGASRPGAVVAVVALLAALAWAAWSPVRAALASDGVLSGTGPTAAVDAAGLDDELARRVEAAQGAAAAEGVELWITSGWRSADEQQRLVDQAVAEHGEAEAHRFVLPPDRSAHVQGLAVDLGPEAGAAWVAEHGAELGLCRVYANEWWHFEPTRADGTCPEQHPDSSWGWD